MDPLSSLIALMRPRTVVSKIVSGSGRWGMRYPRIGSAGLGVVMRGSCHLHVEDCDPVELAEGDFILLPSAAGFVIASDPDVDPDSIEPSQTGEAEAMADVHHGETNGEPEFQLLGGYFWFSPANAPLLARMLPALVHIGCANNTAQRLADTIKLLTEEARAKRPGRGLVLERLIEVLLVEALRYRSEQPGLGVRSGLLTGLADGRVGRALTSFHSDVAGPWSVAALAEEAHLSRTAFSERFTRLVGVPPMTYLLEWRMAVAKDILHRERLPHEVVAAAIGYQSASAFSTAFRREVGQAPGEYARASRAITV